MSIYSDIRASLEKRLLDIPTLSNTFDIAYENVHFKPTTGQPYLKIRNMNTSRTPMTIGTGFEYKYTGVFQIQMNMPEGVGPGASEAWAETITDVFINGLPLSFDGTYIRINDGELASTFDDPPFYTSIINVYWFCFQPSA